MRMPVVGTVGEPGRIPCLHPPGPVIPRGGRLDPIVHADLWRAAWTGAAGRTRTT